MLAPDYIDRCLYRYLWKALWARSNPYLFLLRHLLMMALSRWNAALAIYVRQLAESWEDVMDQSAEAYGITVSQWRYLRELWEEDALAVGDLTRRVGRQGPTTVVAVQLLEKAGMVMVTKSPDHRRKSLVRLTPRGKRLAETISPLIRGVNERRMADLSEAEIRTFKRLIVRIQQTLILNAEIATSGRSDAPSDWQTK